MHKAAGGLIRADFEVIEKTFGAVSLSGDFFCFPEQGIQWLEAWLQGKPIHTLDHLLERFYAENTIETPGIEMDDWKRLLSVGRGSQ